MSAVFFQLPELSSQLTQGAGFGVFLFQNVGFLMGIGLMMIIALYEDKLSKIGWGEQHGGGGMDKDFILNQVVID